MNAKMRIGEKAKEKEINFFLGKEEKNEKGKW